ncbi:MAG TPA: hypothetical protein VFR23_21460 [Jiangellaceae bacterium]|nr:hypothetical protein [Jiangellaceae bacterium]
MSTVIGTEYLGAVAARAMTRDAEEVHRSTHPRRWYPATGTLCPVPHADDAGYMERGPLRGGRHHYLAGGRRVTAVM